MYGQERVGVETDLEGMTIRQGWSAMELQPQQLSQCSFLRFGFQNENHLLFLSLEFRDLCLVLAQDAQLSCTGKLCSDCEQKPICRLQESCCGFIAGFAPFHKFPEV